MTIFGLEIGVEPVGLLMGVFEPQKYTQMYNCNVYNVEDIPLANRQSIPLGLMFLTLGLICRNFEDYVSGWVQKVGGLNRIKQLRY
ncbi:hypothetical protein niasHT_013066 [Heterodera trifolii]|uniref:Uncharacterized protein n=1 Tax=Heterodera trifolii TaxID=157864 RepID=A0ABD2LF85_9BILA